jgi:hypothetical protein
MPLLPEGEGTQARRVARYLALEDCLGDVAVD